KQKRLLKPLKKLCGFYLRLPSCASETWRKITPKHAGLDTPLLRLRQASAFFPPRSGFVQHALQRTRPSRLGCNRTPSWAGSLSLVSRPPRTHDEIARELSDKKMKRFIPLLVGSLLVLSLALNIFLWSRLSSQNNQLKSAQASANEIDELRRQNQELQMNRTSAADSASANARE